jgi:hypothetical protein
MQYEIRLLVDARDKFVELSRHDFEQAWDAKQKLVLALDIEDKLELVLGNYSEFEQELLDVTLRFALFKDFDWTSNMGQFLTINRRIVNFLSACRLYVDQVKHAISAAYGKPSSQYDLLCKSFSEEYNGHLAYRVLEALRNHVQHRGLPAAHFNYNWEREGPAESMRERLIATVSLSVSQIKEENKGVNRHKFPIGVLTDLERGGDLVDLKPLVRQYVASLGRVHQGLRNVMEPDVANWERALEEVRDRFRQAYGNNLIGLALVAKNDDGEIAQSSDVFDDLIKRRRTLEDKNSKMDMYDKQHVTSEVRQRERLD